MLRSRTFRIIPFQQRIRTSSTSSFNSVVVSSPFRFCSTSTTQQQQQHQQTPFAEVADISPMTPRERESAQENIVEQRIDRFLHDMYRQPVFSPLVLFFCIVGLGGFLITWTYNVANPLYLAHQGRTSDDEGGDDSSQLG